MPSPVNEMIAQAEAAASETRDADAYGILRQAMPLCRGADDERALVVALKRLGHLQRDRGRIDASRQSYASAVTLSRHLDDPLLLAHSLRHLGDRHREAGSRASARALCAEALAIYREHPAAEPLDVANAIRSVAVIETEGRSAASAGPLWREALSLYAAAGVPEGVAECRSHLSLTGDDRA